MTGYGRLGVELARVRALQAAHVARELDHGDLHAEADAEVRDPVLAGDPGREDLALDAAAAEPAGHEDAVDARRAARSASLGARRLGVDPADARRSCRGGYRRASAPRRPRGRRPCSLTYLPTSAISTSPSRAADPLGQRVPRPRGRPAAQPRCELLADERVEALVVERPRDEVDVVDVAVRDDRLSCRCRRRARSSRGCRARAASLERQTTMSGWIPMRRSSFTECWVGLVFSSPAASMNGTSVTCT